MQRNQQVYEGYIPICKYVASTTVVNVNCLLI